MVTGGTVYNSLRIGLMRLLETVVVQGDGSWGSTRGAALLWLLSDKSGPRCCFFWSTLLRSRTWSSRWCRLERALVMRQLTDALRSIFFPLRSRCSHLDSGALFPLTLYLAVIVPGVWVLLLSTKIEFYGRFLFSWVQYLVQQWIHVLRQYFGGYGRISHIFYVAADSNPEVLLSLLLQKGEVCPVDASGCSFALRSSHLEIWKYFYELHVAEMRDDGQLFLEHLCQTQAPGGAGTPGVRMPIRP